MLANALVQNALIAWMEFAAQLQSHRSKLSSTFKKIAK
jgi:hypothetical protein